MKYSRGFNTLVIVLVVLILSAVFAIKLYREYLIWFN